MFRWWASKIHSIQVVSLASDVYLPTATHHLTLYTNELMVKDWTNNVLYNGV